MKLIVYTPIGVAIEQEVVQVVAESPAGEFCLKPNHIDYVTSLIPGILSYVTPANIERFVAVADGILVKQGPVVSIASGHAIQGALGDLRDELAKVEDVINEREKANRSAVAKLEVGFLRRFMDFGNSV